MSTFAEDLNDLLIVVGCCLAEEKQDDQPRDVVRRVCSRSLEQILELMNGAMAFFLSWDPVDERLVARELILAKRYNAAGKDGSLQSRLEDLVKNASLRDFWRLLEQKIRSGLEYSSCSLTENELRSLPKGVLPEDKTVSWGVTQRLLFADEDIGGFVVLGDQEQRSGADGNNPVQVIARICALAVWSHVARKSADGIIGALGACIDSRDPYTQCHSERVADYALLIAEGMEINLSGCHKKYLRWCGLLHDLGKIGVSDDALKGKGMLSDRAGAEMNSHSAQTRAVLERINAEAEGSKVFPTPVISAVYNHHGPIEHQQAQAEKELGGSWSAFGHILRVADFLDAITSERVYHVAEPFPVALRMIQERHHPETVIRGLREAQQWVEPHIHAGQDFMTLMEYPLTRKAVPDLYRWLREAVAAVSQKGTFGGLTSILFFRLTSKLPPEAPRFLQFLIERIGYVLSRHLLGSFPSPSICAFQKGDQRWLCVVRRSSSKGESTALVSDCFTELYGRTRRLGILQDGGVCALGEIEHIEAHGRGDGIPNLAKQTREEFERLLQKPKKNAAMILVDESEITFRAVDEKPTTAPYALELRKVVDGITTRLANAPEPREHAWSSLPYFAEIPILLKPETPAAQ